MKSLLLSTVYAVISAAFMLSARPANAAELRHGVTEEGRGFYVLDGDIERGDAEKLIDLIQSDLYRLANSDGLLVNSRGGDVAEAIKISEVIERYWLPVEVASDGECSSACFFLYVAAPKRSGYGTVRVHAPYYDLTGVDATQYAEYANASRQVHEATRSFLLARSVPSDVIEKMLRLVSTSAYTLTTEDRHRIDYQSAFAKEIGAQRCGGLRTDRLMTPEEIRAYKSCMEMALREARLSHVWGGKSGTAKAALGDLGQAFRLRVIPSTAHSTSEKLDIQKELGAIVTTSAPETWLEAFDRYLTSKNL